MAEKDWGTEPLDTESYKETCNRCGAVYEITVTEGPKHGGWNEKWDIQCECGNALPRPESFHAPNVRKLKPVK